VSRQVDALIKQSVEYAFEHHYKVLADYVKMHAQEMSEVVMRQHIDLYVNNYSINLNEDGKQAVLKLVEVFNQLNNSNPSVKRSSFFLNN